MNLYLDTEFTGLVQKTSLISLALLDEDGNAFYAEFNDYTYPNYVEREFLATSVIPQLTPNHLIDNTTVQTIVDVEDGYLHSLVNRLKEQGDLTQIRFVCGNKNFISVDLANYLRRYQEIKIWSDCLAYDWVLFCGLFGGALSIPRNIYYIPFDLSTAFLMSGIDPDVNRLEFSDLKSSEYSAHHALTDAAAIRRCVNKLYKRGLVRNQAL